MVVVRRATSSPGLASELVVTSTERAASISDLLACTVQTLVNPSTESVVATEAITLSSEPCADPVETAATALDEAATTGLGNFALACYGISNLQVLISDERFRVHMTLR